MVFEKKNDTRVNKITSKEFPEPCKRSNKKKQLKIGKERAKESVSIGNKTDDSSKPHFSSDEYIEFCFGENGAFDFVIDGKDKGKSEHDGHSSVNENPRRSRPINRKLDYGDDAERVNECRHADGDYTSQTNDEDCVTPPEKDEKKESTGDAGKRYQNVEIEDRGIVSAESRDSNQSEDSTGSFAFPVLGWEWIDSPVQMPKSEGLHLRKQKVRPVRFQCCRF
ncbi:protein BREAKING OF ASYMMETRY IN THE STOMATAL LINEAGE [Quillaja saponaria]|uniref:Protein BREAKING OF ASYMMETRY IN THE STOMATAL LINEAGE n=1 Tax=Quillaja saponaria TaxID=32244 RepID=A0AAD7QC40_QUISA|nr:protein BREAKING OF ASYMMETRY IN THE STOMATAL LINEAGE [Quillaja saponaria]